MFSQRVASAIIDGPSRIPCRTVVVKSQCRICGQTEESKHNIPEGVPVPQLLMRTCKDCATKYDSLGRPIRQPHTKTLSLDFHRLRTDKYANVGPLDGMTGTRKTPGTPEPQDAETLAVEAFSRRLREEIAQDEVLDLIKDPLTRELVRLRLTEGKSILKTCRELNARGFKISRSYVPKLEKKALAKLKKRLKPLGLDMFMGASITYATSLTAAGEELLAAPDLLDGDLDDSDADFCEALNESLADERSEDSIGEN